MMFEFIGDVPSDILIEREVHAAVEAGHRLPRWGWPVPGPYNGSTGAERVAGWQKLLVANRLGLLPWPTSCSVCLHNRNISLHAENYFRPIVADGVCRACHYHLHRRFRHPAPWQALVLRTPEQSWARRLRMVELSRDEAILAASAALPF